METLARFGYIAKGFVYGAIGILALLTAFNAGGETTDTTGALHAIAAQPFGQILLALIAFGLVGYVLWRLIQAIADPGNIGKDTKGILTRLGYFFSGIVYAGVATNAAFLAIGSSSSEGKSKQDWTAIVLAQPFGRWLVGIAGAVTIGIGFWRIYQAYKTKFRQQLNLNELSLQQKNFLVNISRIGIGARGIVFVMIGFFILQAAHQYNPEKVRGLDGALFTLTQQPFGKLLLAMMALGLISYAVYLLMQARYRRIKTS